jgi:hypothetical protein
LELELAADRELAANNAGVALVPQMAHQNLSLPELLRARARGSSDLRLAFDAGGGLLVAAAMIAFRPPVWSLVLPAALCFAGYGVWAILDRELDEPTQRSFLHLGVLRAGRTAAALVGALAALALGLSALFLALGTWIS